jgi:hypothetical protein
MMMIDFEIHSQNIISNKLRVVLFFIIVRALFEDWAGGGSFDRLIHIIYIFEVVKRGFKFSFPLIKVIRKTILIHYLEIVPEIVYTLSS